MLHFSMIRQDVLSQVSRVWVNDSSYFLLYSFSNREILQPDQTEPKGGKGLGKDAMKLLKTEGPMTAGLRELWLAKLPCMKENQMVSTCWFNSSCAAETDTGIAVGQP